MFNPTQVKNNSKCCHVGHVGGFWRHHFCH
jgi:hypothetical protein